MCRKEGEESDNGVGKGNSMKERKKERVLIKKKE